MVLITKERPIEAALRAVEEVLRMARHLGVRVRVLEVGTRDWGEALRIAGEMRRYDSIDVVIGGGLRIPQALTLLAAMDSLDRVSRITVYDHDTGDEVEIPKWLINLLTSPERRGKLRVLKVLSLEEGLTRGEIAFRVGLSEQTVAKYLSFLQRAGLVRRVMPGKYRLTEKGLMVKKLYFLSD